MRIFVLIYEFPPVGGGGGKAAEDICRYLVRQGHEVQVLTAHLKGLPRAEQRDGVQIWRIPSGRKLAYKAGLWAMGGYVLVGFWAGLMRLKEWRPDVIHAHFAVPSGALAWIYHHLTGLPYLLTAHLGDVPGGVPEKTGRWFRWIYPFTPPIWRSAARVIAVSEYTRQLALVHYPVEIMVIPNGIDLDKVNPGEIRLGQPPRVVFAGRFVPQKNPLLIVRTLAALKDLPWTCILIGDGPLRPSLEAEIAMLGLTDRIQLTGWVTPETVVDWFSRSDLLFMPSLSEGLPVVGVQALAMGLAILASRVGGFLELVREGENGFLLASGDQDGFVNALRRMLENPQLLYRFRQNSLAKAAQFDIGAVGQAYEVALRQMSIRPAGS